MQVLGKKEDGLLDGRSIKDDRLLYEGRGLERVPICCVYEKSVEV